MPGSLPHDFPPPFAAFRLQVNNSNPHTNHIEIVFDHEEQLRSRQDGRARPAVAECRRSGGRWWATHPEIYISVLSAGGTFRIRQEELHALRSARQRGGGLTRLDVMQPHVVERLQLVLMLGDVLEELQGVVHGHLRTIGDAAPCSESPRVSRLYRWPFADLASDVNIGQEMHLNFDEPPFTLAASRRPPFATLKL